MSNFTKIDLTYLVSIVALSIAAATSISSIANAHTDGEMNHGAMRADRSYQVTPYSGRNEAKKERQSVKIDATLRSGSEVPPVGAPPRGAMMKGIPPQGKIEAEIKTKQNKVCYVLTLNGAIKPTLFHIHKAPVGVNGPVVLPLPTPVGRVSRSCVSAPAALIQELAKSPQDFYFNVHNADSPKGAIRGQISKDR